MNASDVIRAVKRLFGDESGVQLLDSDIIRWINEGQREVVKQNEEALQRISTTDIVAEQEQYDLPSDILIVHTIRFRSTTENPYRKLQGMSLVQFDTYMDGWDGPNTSGLYKGEPQVFCVQQGKLILFPSPVANVTSGLKILYTKLPTQVVSGSDNLDVPDMFHEAVMHYCMRQAYMMDENPEGAAQVSAFMQADLRNTKQFDHWNPRDKYPCIVTMPEDQ